MTDPMSIYGPEHYDGEYFLQLRRWLDTQKFKRGVEIGFAWGMSAHAYLETQESKLISIDLNDNMGRGEGTTKVYGDRWEFIAGDSSATLASLPGKFDYIYIDGDHDAGPVMSDLLAAHKKLDKGGVIVCDDYGNPCGVKESVDAFCKDKNYSLEPMPENPNGGVILRKKSA